MRSIKSIGLAVGLLAGVTVACGAQHSTDADEANATAAEIKNAFDVNDVSILFPLKPTNDGDVPYPQIRVSGVDPDNTPIAEQFWSKQVFDQVIAQARQFGLAGDGSPSFDIFTLRGLWHIVGFRFDPCAPGFEDAALAAVGGKCLIQVRLIAQPFVPGGFGSSDFTTHLVFNLGQVEKGALAQSPVIQGAVKMLGEIKDASEKAGAKTSGQPLGVHPGLEAEAKANGSQLATLVRTFIKTFAKGPSRGLAFMGLKAGGPEPWTFFSGRVANDQFTLEPGPAHGRPSQTLSFIDPGGPVMEKSKLPVHTAPLFGNPNRFTPAERELAFKVENPKTQHFFNTDCLSCHTSSARINELGLGDKAEIAARTQVPANITGYVAKTQAQDDAWNTRNFGYFFDKPTVSGRTVTETVEVVEWINKNVRVPGANLNGPGRDCSKVDVDVFRCFRDGKSGCLDKCAPAPEPTDGALDRSPLPLPIDPAAAGDPCVTASVGGAPTVQVQVENSASEVHAQLGGNNSACLSRVFGGAFTTTEGLTMGCASPSLCGISIRKTGADGADGAIRLTGAEAKRFRQFFRVADGGFFLSRSQDENSPARVQILCESDEACDITLTTDASKLPAPKDPKKRVNP